MSVSSASWPRDLRCRSAAARFWNRGFESRRRHGGLSFVNVVCREVEVPATPRSLFQRNPTKSSVAEWEREASGKRRHKKSLFQLSSSHDSRYFDQGK